MMSWLINTIQEFYFRIYDVFRGTYTLRILEAFFDLLVQIAPYFLVSILIQCVLKQFIQKKGIHLKTNQSLLSIFIAGLLGIISPLPTYAAVPIGLSFLALGVPFRAMIAFIIASPLMNPSIFFLTTTQLGLHIALARLITAFVLAVGGGFLAQFIFRSSQQIYETQIKEKILSQRSFWKDFYRTSLYLGKYFLFALILSAAVKALVSPELITRILGQYVQRSLIIAIAMGIPFYNCGGAAIPLIEVLQEMGMNDGAVLAFFIAGPATKAETLFIYKSLLGMKILGFYMVLTITGAYLSGLIFYYIF